jgi:hypothetical protein
VKENCFKHYCEEWRSATLPLISPPP